MSENPAPEAAGTLLVGLPGPRLDDATRRRLARLRPAGVILFGRNLETPESTIRLLGTVRETLEGPVLLAIDQEGGSVSRLAPWIGETPSAAALAAGDPGRVRRFGELTADAVRALGFNLDFAPVVDLCPVDANNGIGGRSFGTDPATAAALAGEFLDGLQSHGVAGCLKHFPGLGDTTVDSHAELPTIERDLDRLREEDLDPFRRLAGRAATIMVGHGHYPALVQGPSRPASCSAEVVGLLRGEIPFEGLIVTDDMEMGAVGDRDRDGAAAVEALRAGCDLLLYCADLDRADRALAAIRDEARRDPAFAGRVADAATRVADLGRRWPVCGADAAVWRTACSVVRDSFSLG